MTSREFRDRLLKRARKADVQVVPAVLELLEAYYRLLAKWNEKINLTALPLRELTDAALDRLLIEPLAAARYIPEGAVVWFDLGSGGGSPALPLKAVRPSARLTLVESKARKAAFLREAIRSLGLSGAVVDGVRFEELVGRTTLHRTAQLVTVRAVRLDKAFFDVARTLLAPDGSLFLFSSFEMGPRVAKGFETHQTVRLAPAARIGSLPSSQLVILRRTAASA